MTRIQLDSNSKGIDYSYDALSRITRKDYTGGSYSTYVFDGVGRLESIQHKRSDESVIYTQTNTPDNVGNIVSKVNNVFYGVLFGVWLKDANCGFRLIRKEVIDDVIDDVKYLKYAFASEFLIRAAKKGYKVAEMPVEHYARDSKVFSPFNMPKVAWLQIKGLIKLRIDLWKKK